MDKRLLTCVRLCKGRIIADIGTDHGYLPCYMVTEGLCDKAYACDVAPMPLESARQHINSQGLSDKIQPVLSDGLKNVPSDGTTDVVIAGMGGELISAILSDCDWIKDPSVNLVLQPMTKWDVLRKWLYENGFEVTKELPCCEGKFTYSVIQCHFTGDVPEYKCGLRYLYCGMVDSSSEDGKAYISRQAKRLFTAGNGMAGSDDADKKELSAQMLALSAELEQELKQ